VEWDTGGWFGSAEGTTDHVLTEPLQVIFPWICAVLVAVTTPVLYVMLCVGNFGLTCGMTVRMPHLTVPIDVPAPVKQCVSGPNVVPDPKLLGQTAYALCGHSYATAARVINTAPPVSTTAVSTLTGFLKLENKFI
jgi:hypothetical protein